MERSLGDCEGACHLNHLALANREIANDGIGGNAVAWKDLVEFVTN